MVKAMADYKTLRDKVDLTVQVAGPNAQRQIQQINAMVQQGAKAIIIFPISPTALNQVVKNACDKGVIVFAYDAEITEPCAYNTHIDQDEAGRVTAQWLVDKLGGKGNIVIITGVPGTSVDTQRTAAAKAVFAKHPDIQIIGEAVGMWSQAVARTELSKILATHNWNEIDGLWMQVGCYTAASMQDEAGIPDNKKKPCAGEGSNGHRIQMLPAGTKVDGAIGHLSADGISEHLLRLAALLGRSRAEARRRQARGQGRAEAHQAAAAGRHQRHDQVVPRRNLGGNEGWVQRLQPDDCHQSRLVRLDFLGADAGDRLERCARRPARELILATRRGRGRLRLEASRSARPAPQGRKVRI